MNKETDQKRSSRDMGSKELRRMVGMPLREIGEEFIDAGEMQRVIMPDPERLESFCDFDLYARTIPIAMVGGDFYDFIDLDGRFGMTGKMGIVVADAAGHGLAAAMLIRDFNTALYTGISFMAHYEQDTTPFLFTRINRRMYRSSRANQFIACFYGELRRDGVLRYINAGHRAPILFRPDREDRLTEGGPALGAFHKLPEEYRVGEVQLGEEDILVCATDGILEAFNDRGDEYGEQRLIDVVRNAGEGTSSRGIFDAVVADVRSFSKQTGQEDDRTLMVIRTQECAG